MSRLLNFRGVSRLLTVLAIGFLISMFISADLWTLLGQFELDTIIIILALSLVLTLGWMAPALAWARLVDRLAKPAKLSATVHLEIYARTQIQKYIPGNIFHFIVRHVEARHRGEDDEPLFWACVGELVGQPAAAGMVAAVGLGLSIAAPSFTFTLLILLLTAIISYLLVHLLRDLTPKLVSILIKVAGTRGRDWYATVDLETTELTPRHIVAVLPLYALYIIILGTVACTLGFTGQMSLTTELIPFVIGVTALAWIAGFILPGAPGGLGPREAVITAFLAPVTTVETALFIAFSLRLCTILSDFCLFLLGVLISHVQSRQADPLNRGE